MSVVALRERAPDSPALRKYADVGRPLVRQCLDDRDAIAALAETLDDWTRRLELPRLVGLWHRPGRFPRIVAYSRGSSMKTNPVVLTDAELSAVLASNRQPSRRGLASPPRPESRG